MTNGKGTWEAEYALFLVILSMRSQILAEIRSVFLACPFFCHNLFTLLLGRRSVVSRERQPISLPAWQFIIEHRIMTVALSLPQSVDLHRIIMDCMVYRSK